MSDHAKRTRSQLSLTEEVGDVHLGISPLKAARQEQRKNIPVASPLVSSELHAPLNVGANQNDDGPLLSHHEDRPQKRTSPKPQEDDPERQFKRLKKDHIEGEWDDGPPHAHDLHPEESRVTEATRPSGPFDFSAISPKDLLSSTGSRQLGASWTKRAQSAPLVSPSAPNRNLGQLMPSPRKTASVSPVRETFRFSSLPRALGPFAGDTVVRNVGKPSTEPERDNGLTTPHISPASNEMGISLREKPTPEADTSRPCDDQFPAAGPSLEVTASDVSLAGPLLPPDFCVTTPTTSPKGQDSDITPKATAPVPSSPPGGRLTPVPSSDPLSPLTDDPPSPLSALSSLSELDDNPSLSDYEMRASVEPPSRNSQEVDPPLSSLITASKSIDALPPVARPVTGATSRGRGRRGFTVPYGSARLTRSSTTREKRETGSLPRDSAARSQSTFSIVPGPSSHKQSFSFAMPTSSSLNKAVERAPVNSPQKPWSLPKRQPPKLLSPMKPASSLGAPSRSKHTGLSNLSLALEKLKAPPPSRPATTLGFTRDTDSVIGTSKPTPKAMDDSTVHLGNGLPLSARMAATPLKRAASVGSAASLQPNAHASGSKTTTVITRPSNLPPAAGPVAKISLNSGIVVGKSSFSKPRGFVYGGVGKRRPFEKVSKKSSLPVVEASPVKGSESSRVVNGNPGELPLLSVGHMLPPASVSRGKDDSQAAAPAPAPPLGIEPMKLQEAFTGSVGVPKADEKTVGDLADVGEAELPDVWKDASRRASLASQFLQQTLAVLPATPPPGGSKSTAVVRPRSSSQGTRSGLRSSSGLDVAGSRSASGALSNSPGVRTHVSHSGTTAGAPSATKPSSLKVLKSCTIFVDVRTDDGDDAGGLFVDMLRGLGAKIIGRAGQSCTHIVYKNGLMSTLTKYRLMREPKPLVVGISWVVECTEQRRRVEESDFIVDLEGLNIAGNNKRRRSMLPKHISSNIQSHTMAAPSQPSSSLGGTLMSDQSLDGSSVGADHSLHSSDGFVEDEDDLPPLERARQRRNIFFKR